MGAFAAIPQMALAEGYIDLEWADLVPAEQPFIPPMIQELLQHDQVPLSSQQPESMGVRTDWNGQIVRLPGFIVPIEYSGTGVTAFMLVPFVGACIHVPPPPAACNPICVSQVPQVCDVRYGARPQWHLPPAGAAGRPQPQPQPQPQP